MTEVKKRINSLSMIHPICINMASYGGTKAAMQLLNIDLGTMCIDKYTITIKSRNM